MLATMSVYPYCGGEWGVPRWRRQNVTSVTISDGSSNLTEHLQKNLQVNLRQEVPLWAGSPGQPATGSAIVGRISSQPATGNAVTGRISGLACNRISRSTCNRKCPYWQDLQVSLQHEVPLLAGFSGQPATGSAVTGRIFWLSCNRISRLVCYWKCPYWQDLQVNLQQEVHLLAGSPGQPATGSSLTGRISRSTCNKKCPYWHDLQVNLQQEVPLLVGSPGQPATGSALTGRISRSTCNRKCPYWQNFQVNLQ
ncbi:hypothetical protein AB205_0200970, partial [Aquarana catesbeiana]